MTTARYARGIPAKRISWLPIVLSFGVWIGAELDAPWQGKAMDVVKASGDVGLMLLVAGPDVVRFAPSLVISLDEILEGLARLELALHRALV